MSVTGASGVIRLRLSPPEADYDQEQETDRNLSLENADKSNFKHFEDVDLANNERLILVSANGTRYSVTVSDAGTLGTTAV
jgi:hypothetical protein|tara:strand:+ start:1148 stop:1390 length:243 start_codon:yes stop_codon:yes gene_type:complete